MAQSAAAPERFVGTWTLVSVRARRSDGSLVEPYGPEPLGRITYSADGHMHAIVKIRSCPGPAHR